LAAVRVAALRAVLVVAAMVAKVVAASAAASVAALAAVWVATARETVEVKAKAVRVRAMRARVVLPARVAPAAVPVQAPVAVRVLCLEAPLRLVWVSVLEIQAAKGIPVARVVLQPPVPTPATSAIRGLLRMAYPV
jgi:hypothetical protein